MEGGIQRPLRSRALLPPCSDEALVRSFQIGIGTAWLHWTIWLDEYGKEAGHPFDLPDWLGGALGCLYSSGSLILGDSPTRPIF